MKVIDILTEASIFTKPERYPFGHKVRVAVGGKKGTALFDMIKRSLPDFDASEDLEWVATGPANSVIDVGQGADVGWFKRPNGTVFGIRGSGKAWEKALTHAPGQKGSTAENKGDLSEPVLSAAVVAKLIKRGGKKIADITAEDVKHVLNTAINSDGTALEVNDLDSLVADKIVFTIALRAPTLEFMKDPRFWDVYGGLLPSAVHYANSGQIDRYADYFYKNGKVDVVTIKSDGMSDQKSRKTDIEATVNGRPLKNLNISLKAGSPHIGQVGGGKLDNPMAEKGVWFNANRLFGPLGVEIPPPKKNLTSKVAFWVSAYKEAAKQIKAQLKGTDPADDTGVVKRIVDMVTSHGTSGDPNVKLVSLLKTGVSSVHSFKGLFNKIASNNIQLDCDYREGKSKVSGDPRPELRIFDKTSGQALMYIRYSSTEDEMKIWNTVEMKELLKQLTTLSYQKPVGSAPELTSQPAPKATPPAPKAVSKMATPAPSPTAPVTTQPRADDAEFVEPDDELRYSGE